MANKKRLIDANALAEKAFTAIGTFYGRVIKADDLYAAPTVDAVEVVRCKDCDNTCPGTFGMVCTVWGSRTDPDGWCYKGERREGE